ncbi:MAG: hypothetical protein HY000_13275 [Planctomycetes bacterium]|nr:hypothetical protein [Planctomycetota bacterium]
MRATKTAAASITSPELARLLHVPPEDLWLPSLRNRQLSGRAYRYTLVLPLLDGQGNEVFSSTRDIPDLNRLLNARFLGSTNTSDTPKPPLLGYWLGEEGSAGMERNMSITVYSRVIDEADLFFEYLKAALKNIGKQQEVLIERVDVWLPGDRPPPE